MVGHYHVMTAGHAQNFLGDTLGGKDYNQHSGPCLTHQHLYHFNLFSNLPVFGHFLRENTF